MDDRYRRRDADQYRRDQPLYQELEGGSEGAWRARMEDFGPPDPRSGYAQERSFDRGGSAPWRDAGYGREPDRGLLSRYGEQDSHFGFGEFPHEHDRDHRPGRGRLTRQLRGAGAQMTQSFKSVFRGPKGYTRSDERIREDVSDRLSEQDHLDPTEIEVTVSGGEVTLSGSVQSRQEKFWAEELADAVRGVREVHNQLRIRRPEELARESAPETSARPTPSRGDGPRA